jgi:hypothetical protein
MTGCYFADKNIVNEDIFQIDAHMIISEAFYNLHKEQSYRYGYNHQSFRTIIFNAPDLFYCEEGDDKIYRKGNVVISESLDGTICSGPPIRIFKYTTPEKTLKEIPREQWDPWQLRHAMIFSKWTKKGFYSPFITEHLKELRKYLNSSCYQGIVHLNNIPCHLVTVMVPNKQLWSERFDTPFNTSDAEIIGFQATLWISKEKLMIQKIRYTMTYHQVIISSEERSPPESEEDSWHFAYMMEPLPELGKNAHKMRCKGYMELSFSDYNNPNLKIILPPKIKDLLP